MKIKREIFSRGVRMTHQFDELLGRNDPTGAASSSFDVPWPKRVDDLGRRGFGSRTSQEYGQHNDRPDSSPICKPNGGCARMDGPEADAAMERARPVPVGTKRRYGPLKTDK